MQIFLTLCLSVCCCCLFVCLLRATDIFIAKPALKSQRTIYYIYWQFTPALCRQFFSYLIFLLFISMLCRLTFAMYFAIYCRQTDIVFVIVLGFSSFFYLVFHNCHFLIPISLYIIPIFSHYIHMLVMLFSPITRVRTHIYWFCFIRLMQTKLFFFFLFFI